MPGKLGQARLGQLLVDCHDSIRLQQSCARLLAHSPSRRNEPELGARSIACSSPTDWCGALHPSLGPQPPRGNAGPRCDENAASRGMITPEDIERAIARLTAEAKLWACLDAIEARLLSAGIERDAISGSRTSEPLLAPGADRFYGELCCGQGRE